MGRLRVCQLIGYYDHGGICRVAVELTLRLRKFFEVTLVCRKVLRKPEEDVEIVELGSKNTADLWKKLHKLREQFNIIHTRSVLPSSLCERKVWGKGYLHGSGKRPHQVSDSYREEFS